MKNFLKNITIIEVGVGALALVGAVAIGRAIVQTVTSGEAAALADAAVEAVS